MATGMCKVRHGIASDIVNDNFRKRNITYGPRYSRMDQVEIVEDSL